MNTRFLDTFITLAKLRSFRTTATELHATPAAISQRVKALEDELGTVLIDRESREFRLTPNGEYLLGYAKAVVDATRELQAAAASDSAVRGKLRLGVIETVVHSWLAQYMTRLSADYPQLDIDLNVDVSVVLQRRLMAGELDLIIRVEGSDEASVVCDALANYPVHWVARAGLVPNGRSGLAKRVLEHPILTFGRGTAPHRALEDIVTTLARANGVPVAQTRITGSPSISVIVQLVRDGFGVAAIPRLFVDALIESGEVVELPLQPSPPSIVVSMSRRADASRHVHAAATAARAACHEYCAKSDRRLVEPL
ncbi:LysR family transcriptional regulator [Trinickia violacea]|uniref:LysR family transcriptional regulator n=1 Tax=Trinickia violacea TaxID=2571746 RepID=A0A4V1EH41_9BURK|nr:LysR family transcriptional regulator [Trinickia violacea]QCP48950.1 LysR family transcriptional regulator [Trinickia violacea]